MLSPEGGVWGQGTRGCRWPVELSPRRRARGRQSLLGLLNDAWERGGRGGGEGESEGERERGKVRERGRGVGGTENSVQISKVYIW